MQAADNPILDRLFPLQLSAFEEFTLIDDSVDHPMTFFSQGRFYGTVDIEAFNLALRRSVARHPLLCCRIKKRKNGLCWEWAPELMPQLRSVPENNPLWSDSGEFIDLHKEVGLRVWLRPIDDRIEFTYQFHHACCDGIGALQFFSDVAMSYAELTAPETLRRERQKLDLSRLVSRDAKLNRRTIINPRNLFRRMRGTLREVYRHFRQRPIPLEPPSRIANNATSKSVGEPRIYAQLLDKSTSRSLRNAARDAGAFVNDILLRDLLLSLQDWNSRHATQLSKGDFRIVVPTSLRAEGDQETPATNLIGYVFITRSPAALADHASLLQSVQSDMKAILRFKLGWLFLDSLNRLKRFGILNFVKSTFGKGCHATAIHSHLGNTFNQFRSNFSEIDGKISIGNLCLDEVLSTPPLRSLTHVALATYSSRGRLAINLRCDAQKFSDDQAKSFLELFVNRLVKSANE